jgi:hypothetical protein
MNISRSSSDESHNKQQGEGVSQPANDYLSYWLLEVLLVLTFYENAAHGMVRSLHI